MRCLLQRVKKAAVTIDGDIYSSINHGLCLFLGIHHHDNPETSKWIIEKIVQLRVFEDENQKMNKTVNDVNGSILIVSQFTLYGNCNKGRRPNFTQAASPDIAKILYEDFVIQLMQAYSNSYTGVFGAKMDIELINDGPVTLLLER